MCLTNDRRRQWFEISLFLATPEQVKVHRRRTFVQWGRGLALEEYLKRDEAFDGLAHSGSGKFAVWNQVCPKCEKWLIRWLALWGTL